MEVSIDKIEFDLNGLEQEGEEYIDTLNRLGLPVENFVLDVDVDEFDSEDEDSEDEDSEDEDSEDDMDMTAMDIAVEDAVYNYIEEKFGEEYAKRIEGVSWGIY